MHHGSGRYFDITGSGALIWQCIEQEASAAQIAAHFAASYNLPAENAAKIVTDFIAELRAHDLVRAQASATEKELPPATLVAGTFNPPVLGAHDDLADMLLLDPIHDVDEGGWPAARPAAPAP